MCFSKPSMPSITAPPPPPDPEPPPPPPTRDDPEVVDAQRAARKRRISAKGRSSTLLTGGQGVTEEANTGLKTLLGS